jgi:hypothetical protein
MIFLKSANGAMPSAFRLARLGVRKASDGKYENKMQKAP